MSLHPPHREAAELWLSEDPDPKTKAELRHLIEGYDRGDAVARRELHEMFEGHLEFGTAGLRGLFGPGPQRMNRVLIRKVTAGLAHYLLDKVEGAASQGVVICYDGRHNSRVFAEDTARVLAGVKIRSYLAHRAWPTPTAAWAVVDQRAAAGVMITASHNPPQYTLKPLYWGGL
jgi:phosphomannomutase